MIQINTTLRTKDGRKVGNAIVRHFHQGFSLIMTDYGNHMKLTERELNELFYIGKLAEFGKHKHYLIPVN